jgi:hypothetical protein
MRRGELTQPELVPIANARVSERASTAHGRRGSETLPSRVGMRSLWWLPPVQPVNEAAGVVNVWSRPKCSTEFPPSLRHGLF